MIKKDSYEAFTYDILMAVLTVFFCLAFSDGILNMYAYKTMHYWQDVLLGRIVFCIFIVLLPLIFAKKVKWKHTIINLPLYFLMYFPVAEIFGYSQGHLFLRFGGFISFPDYFGATIVAIVFWSIQSLTYMLLFILKKLKKTENNS